MLMNGEQVNCTRFHLFPCIVGACAVARILSSLSL